jgi:type IV secretory pathway VirB2 component (pilin)
MRKHVLLFAGLALLLVSNLALASNATGLPWEDPLQMIADSLTGPVAFAISLVAMAVAGGMLLFGGEMTEFGKMICKLVLALGIMLGGAGLLGTLFGVSGAVVAQQSAVAIGVG